MKTNLKNTMVSFCFMLLLTGFMLANILIPDQELSYSERRKLTSSPDFSIEKLFYGQLFPEFETYCLDQFVLRHAFRSLKALSRIYLFGQKDNNDVYLVDNGIYKMEYPLNEKSVYNAAAKFNEIYESYLQGMNVHYAIIPDKNYFVADQNGYLSMDYSRMVEIMHQNVKHMTYIDLFSSLSIADYYRTDIHWRQDKIIPVADKLLWQMGARLGESPADYIKQEMYPFYGSYYGQSALPISPDSLVYLTNEVLENAILYNYEHDTYGTVYHQDMFGGMDSYNIFLGGAKPLISIENPASTSGKELILLRDSFGSSLAPLLLEGYSKIVLVDLRYISTRLLGDYIDFSPDQDVLFLYGTQVLNNSFMLK